MDSDTCWTDDRIKEGDRTMYQVKKRDGKIAEFNLAKIGEAIRKAFEAQEKIITRIS